MNDPAKTNGHADAVVKHLVAACLEEADRFARGVFDRACEEHPGEAKAIERQYQALLNSGLVGGGPIDGKGPDPWDTGVREALSDPDANSKFDSIGPYQPLKEIGRGGQAVVYLAEDLRLNRPVALKILDGLGPLSETMISRFRREAEVASKLDHPGICAVYDAGVKDGVPYIAMRFVAGETLADHVEAAKKRKDDAGANRSISVGSRTKTEIHRILEIMEKAARALHAAHEAGIIHRDVKPGNIMVTPDGQPVLLDFGLAGDEDGGLMTLTATGDMLGTPAYMSPEQLMAQRIRLDRRTDVYSMGVTLFECLTLERPYRAGTREAMYQAIQYKDPTDIQGLNTALPPDVKVIVETALEKDRDKRYRTAGDLADDLRRVREGEPIAARPVSAVGRVWRWAKRRPARAALIVALILGIPAATALAGHIVANRPAVLESERQALASQIERHLENGFSELSHGDPKKAIISFDAALALEPQSGEAIGGKALALFSAKRYDTCLAFLDKSGDVEGCEWALTRLRIKTLRKLGQKGAANDLEQKTAAEPRTALGYFLAGSQLLQDCRRQTDKEVFRSAFRYFKRATLTATHARPLYHMELAHAAVHLDEEATSRSAAEALMTLWPDSWNANRWAGSAFLRMDLDAAMAAYRRAIELKPDRVAPHLGLGEALFSKSRVDESIAAYRKAIELNPKFAKPHARLGVVLKWKSEQNEDKELLAEAEASLRKAIELEPEGGEHYGALAAILATQGGVLGSSRRPDEAIAAYRRAIDLHPGIALHHRGLGMLLCNEGQFEAAVEQFTKAIELDPDDAWIRCYRGNAYRGLGRFNQAIASHRKAVRMDPKEAEFHYQLADSLTKARRYDDAIESHKEAIKLKPDYAEVHCDLGSIYCDNKGDYDRAIECFEKAKKLKPTLLNAHKNLAVALMKKGCLDEAIAAKQKVIELSPGSASAHSELAGLLRFKGRLSEAIAAARKATELAPDNADFRFQLGMLLQIKRRYDEAIAAYRKAVKVDPGYTMAMVNIGAILCDVKGKYSAAIVEFRKAIAADPKLANAYLSLAVALRSKGRPDEAVAAALKGVKLAPRVAQAHTVLSDCYRSNGQFALALTHVRRGLELPLPHPAFRLGIAQLLQMCEKAALRRAGRLVAEGEDAEAWSEAAEILEALVKGWQKDVARGQRKRAVAGWVDQLTRRQPWVTVRDPEQRETLAPAERERWDKIWTAVDELQERIR